MSGFVYLWFDRKHTRFYIGCHWGSPDDGYICSSRWMRKAYKRRPQDFKRRLLSVVQTTRRELLVEEQRWLNLIKRDELGKRYYNVHRHASLWATDPHACASAVEKANKSRIGKPTWMKGKKHSDESKRKISEAGRGRVASEETLKKRSKSLKGIRWYTNGISDQRIRPGEEIPDGFRPGRTKGLNNLFMLAEKWNDPDYRQHMSDAHKDIRWYTDGVNDQMLREGADIPIGFKLGRTNGSR